MPGVEKKQKDEKEASSRAEAERTIVIKNSKENLPKKMSAEDIEKTLKNVSAAISKFQGTMLDGVKKTVDSIITDYTPLIWIFGLPENPTPEELEKKRKEYEEIKNRIPENIQKRLESEYFTQAGKIEILDIDLQLFCQEKEKRVLPEIKRNADKDVINAFAELNKSKRPNVGLVPHSNLYQNIRNPSALYNDGIQVKEGRTATTFLSLSADGVKFPNNQISEYDLQIHNAICSLYHAGNTVITPRQVCSFLKGKSSNNGIKQSSIDKIKKSIDRMMKMQINIDATDVLRERGITSGSITQSSFFLPLSEYKYDSEDGQKPRFCYHINSTPPLLEHDEALNQVYYIDIKFYECKSLPMTEKNTILRGYLLQRITAAKGGQQNKKIKQSRIIKYSTIFEKLELVAPYSQNYENTEKGKRSYNADRMSYNQEASRVRKNIKKFMEEKKADGYIKDFKELKSGKTFDSIEVFF